MVNNSLLDSELEIDEVYPPGEHILELLEEKDMTQAELALRMGMSAKAVNQILHGNAPLTINTAQKLELVFDVPSHFWSNLDLMHQEYLKKIEEFKILNKNIEWAKEFPCSEMKKLGILSKGRGVTERTVKRDFKCSECGHIAKLKDLPECEIYGHLLCSECYSTQINIL